MAASEGQLAVELVQSLTAEARAHREYLQSLYTITLSVMGGGFILVAGAFFWLGRQSIKSVERTVQDTLETKASEFIEKKTHQVTTRIEQISGVIEELESAKNDAQSQLNSIAELASDARNIQRNSIENEEKDFDGHAIIVREPGEEWVTKTAYAELGSFIESNDIENDEILEFFDEKPTIFIVTQDSLKKSNNRINSLFNSFDPKPFLIIVADGTSSSSLATASRVLLNFDVMGEIVTGPATLLDALRRAQDRELE